MPLIFCPVMLPLALCLSAVASLVSDCWCYMSLTVPMKWCTVFFAGYVTMVSPDFDSSSVDREIGRMFANIRQDIKRRCSRGNRSNTAFLLWRLHVNVIKAWSSRWSVLLRVNSFTTSRVHVFGFYRICHAYMYMSLVSTGYVTRTCTCVWFLQVMSWRSFPTSVVACKMRLIGCALTFDSL